MRYILAEKKFYRERFSRFRLRIWTSQLKYLPSFAMKANKILWFLTFPQYVASFLTDSSFSTNTKPRIIWLNIKSCIHLFPLVFSKIIFVQLNKIIPKFLDLYVSGRTHLAMGGYWQFVICWMIGVVCFLGEVAGRCKENQQCVNFCNDKDLILPCDTGYVASCLDQMYCQCECISKWLSKTWLK